MTQFLPPNLLALFAPRDPVPFLPPPCKLPHEKKTRGYIGVGVFLDDFEDPSDTPAPGKVETREERIERRRRERAEQVAYKLEQEIAVWNPHGTNNGTTDAFKTLFVARINYDTSESKLRREFEVYGPIKKIVLSHNKLTGKPRGYAFIEYEHERDMHSAYKHADGKKIDGRRVLVDVERARTVKGWLPRRLGGGLGGTRRGGPEVNLKHSGREDNERERERYRIEREREAERERGDGRRGERGGGGGGAGGVGGGGGGGGDRPERVERGERERERERERPERPERERRPRSRSREKKRRSRSRSRDRKRRRSRERVTETVDLEEVEEKPLRERDRDRDRDRERERRERDRKRARRTRSRERKHRRERDRGDRDKEREKRERDPDYEEKVRIKIEPLDDYPDYSNNYDGEQYDMDSSNIKYEKGTGNNQINSEENSMDNNDKTNYNDENGDSEQPYEQY